MAFNPQATYRGDIHQFAGMQALAGGIGQLGDELKKIKEENKKRDEERKRYTSVIKAMKPEAPVDFASMDYGTIKGLYEATIDENSESLKKAQAQMVQQEVAHNRKISEILQGLSGPSSSAQDPGVRVRDYVDRTMRAGIAPDPKIIQSLAGPDPREERRKDLELAKLEIDVIDSINGKEVEFVEDPKSGKRFARLGNTIIPITNGQPDVRQIKIAGKDYFVGPGNKYFDENGKQVEFSSNFLEALKALAGGQTQDPQMPTQPVGPQAPGESSSFNY